MPPKFKKYDAKVHGPNQILGPGFHQQVFQLVKQIPKGRVVAYGDIAKQLGSIKVARHVGFALAASSNEIDLPWYRVVNGRGFLSMDLTDPRGRRQKRLLKKEGVEVSKAAKVLLFESLRFSFSSLK